MKLYSSDENYKLYNGNMLDMMEVIEPNSIDAIVTDPPYELNFMNKKWDNSGIAFQKETWKKCYDVLKSGGHMLVFGGSRTFHRIACAIEDAGFEIRDTIMWLYGSGFPKSMNIGLAIDKRNGVESPIVGQNEQILKKQAKDLREGKRKIVDSFNSGASERNNGFKTVSADIKLAQNEWAGWGTQLKPSYEPIIVCRKPCENSIVDNVMKYGVGGINIDECRVPISKDDIDMINAKSSKNPTDNYKKNESKKYGDYALNIATTANEQGRFPANTILTYDDSDYNEVCGGFPNSKGSSSQNVFTESSKYGGNSLYESSTKRFSYQEGYNDEGSASRYFYCAKASKRDRDEGLKEFEDYVLPKNGSGKRFTVGGSKEVSLPRKNIHPTVKPTSLMQYLIRLVTPKGGTVLDPFNGSGSTGKACMYENADRNANYKYIGIELTEEYLPISKARIEFAEKTPIMDYEDKTSVKNNKVKDETKNVKNSSSTIFDL